MREDLAQLIVRDLADERASAPQRRRARERVRRGPAADLARGAHLIVQRARAVRVDQLHAALEQPFAREEVVGRGGHHVHDRVADRDDVETIGGVGR